VEILRAVDKLAKIGREETLALLAEIAGKAGGEEIRPSSNRRRLSRLPWRP
jgi:hypothetical protein